jgi:hypothetical protein
VRQRSSEEVNNDQPTGEVIDISRHRFVGEVLDGVQILGQTGVVSEGVRLATEEAAAVSPETPVPATVPVELETPKTATPEQLRELIKRIAA